MAKKKKSGKGMLASAGGSKTLIKGGDKKGKK
jgi:hypothetical protein